VRAGPPSHGVFYSATLRCYAISTVAPDDPSAAPAAPTLTPDAPDQKPVGEAIIQLSAEDMGRWRTRIEKSRTKQKTWHKLWEANLDAYQPKAEDLAKDGDRYDVNPNIDFRQVEQKSALLFYDRPDIILDPEEPLTTAMQAAQVVTLRQAVLNKALGPKPEGVDVLRAVQRALLDILCISGMGWTKLGWRVEMKSVPPDKETMALGLGNEPIDVPIYERAFWDYLPCKRGLAPHDAIGVASDEWDWIGQDFTMPVAEAKRTFRLPDDFETTSSANPALIRDADSEQSRTLSQVSGTEIHYYRSRFDKDTVHPEVVYELILIEGLEQPVRHRPCPYQTLQPDGRLSEDSVHGFLIHPLTIRDAADGYMPLSDCSVTRSLVDELKVYRAQNLKHRDASVPAVMFKEDVIDEQQRDTLKANGYFHWMAIDPAEYPPGADPIKAVALPPQSRDSYTGGEIIERDIERSHSIGANQTGASQTGRRSATEIQAIQSNTDSRLAKEQARLADGFLKGVAKLDALIQRNGAAGYVRVLGPQGAQELIKVDPKQVPGRMLYKIRPDSQLRVDAAQDRAQYLQLYNLIVNSPSVNRFELESQLVRKFGLDPTKLLTPPQPPPPPPPKVSVSITMPDLLTPARPIVAKLLTNQPLTPDDFAITEGILNTMPPVDAQGEAMPQGQPEHGGPAEKATPLDAHQERRTAGLEGVGVTP
jgi:hypothetical protein